MARKTINRYRTGDQNRSRALDVTTDQEIRQGDFVIWDPATFSLRPLTLPADVAGKFLGVAEQTSRLTVGFAAENIEAMVVNRGGIFAMDSTAGDTYRTGDLVTVGADSQSVTKVGATTANAVGVVYVQPPSQPRAQQATPIPPSVTGAAGRAVQVELRPKSPLAV